MAPFPIDAVIPWVDGNDPVLRARRAQYAGEGMLTNDEVGGPVRYVSSGEIRWAVASIFRFASFVRKVFIVTDGQDPSLDEMLQKFFPDRVDDVLIVDHSVIFRGREEYLPTFNSNSIDTLIWNIPDLSEHFLYFNDDMFLVRPVTPEDFFLGERIVCYADPYPAALVRLSRKIRPEHVGYKESMLRALELMGGGAQILYIGHIPCPMLKSWFENWAQERPEMVERNLRYKFRDVAQFEVQEAFYVDMRRKRRLVLRSERRNILCVRHYREGDYIAEKLRRFSADTRRKFACFNSLPLCSQEDLERVSRWLDARVGIGE